MKKYKIAGFFGLNGHRPRDYRYAVLITLLFFILTYWSYQVYQLSSLSDKTQQKDSSSTSGQEKEFIDKIYSLEKQARTLSKNVLIVDAVKEFSKKYNHYGQTRNLTPASSNYNILKKQISYTGVSLKNDLSGSFFKIHPVLKAYCEKFGFEDLMLIDSKNYKLIYSAKTSPGTGKFIQNQNPVQKYNEIFNTLEQDEIATYYLDDRTGAYIASSVRSEGECIGILLFEIVE